MKHNLITLTALSAVLIALAALAGCQQEPIGPETTAPDTDQVTEVIPVYMEGMADMDATLDTKLTIDGDDGTCAWSYNDVIALYAGGTGAGYKRCAVVDGAVRLSLATGQTRANYAIYPYASATGTAATPQVNYPATYDMAKISEDDYETYCPTPMVAVNNTGALRFFHVGALLRLHLTSIPTNVTQVLLTFKGKTVTGTFDVTDTPGSITAKATSAGASNSTVTFTNLSVTRSDLYLNVPLPLGDYSTLTEIGVKYTYSTPSATLEVSQAIKGWGEIEHGHGKKLTIDGVTITQNAGYTGQFGNSPIWLSPGLLIWDSTLNGGQGGYTLTDGEDPFELLNHCTTADKDVYYHQAVGTVNSLKYRMDGNNTSGQNIQNPYIYVDGMTWKIPTSTEIQYLYKSSNSTLNGTTCSYFGVVVNLDGAKDADGNSYLGKGMTSASGGAALNTNYQAGVVLLPRYVTIVLPGFSANTITFNSSTVINYQTLRKLLDGGCAFLPAAGSISGNTLTNYGIEGRYWGSTSAGTYYSTYLFHNLYFNPNALYNKIYYTSQSKSNYSYYDDSGNNVAYYRPVRLVR